MYMATRSPHQVNDEKTMPETTAGEDPTKQLRRGQWLRAAILGANDGVLSTTSLMIGVGAANENRRDMILAGLAGALAGACSMAVGEFVSVSTQRDIERLVLDTCSVRKNNNNNNNNQLENFRSLVKELQNQPSISKLSNTESQSHGIISAALTPTRSPATRVARDDAKSNMLRGLNNVDEEHDDRIIEPLPNPYKAASASALAFLCGSAVPLLACVAAATVPNNVRIALIVGLASVALAVFGGGGAYVGGSPVGKSAGRVVVGGWISMAITYALLKSFDKDPKVHDSD